MRQPHKKYTWRVWLMGFGIAGGFRSLLHQDQRLAFVDFVF